MRFRLGFVTGMATGYYLGAKAGRQRYDQINRTIAKVKRSEAYEEVTEMAKAKVEEAAERAKSAVEEGVEKAIENYDVRRKQDARAAAQTAAVSSRLSSSTTITS